MVQFSQLIHNRFHLLFRQSSSNHHWRSVKHKWMNDWNRLFQVPSLTDRQYFEQGEMLLSFQSAIKSIKIDLIMPGAFSNHVTIKFKSTIEMPISRPLNVSNQNYLNHSSIPNNCKYSPSLIHPPLCLTCMLYWRILYSVCSVVPSLPDGESARRSIHRYLQRYHII